MINRVIDIISEYKLYNFSNEVEIVKGKNEYVTTYKDAFKKLNRAWQSRKL